MRAFAHRTSLTLVTGSRRRLQDLCKTEDSRTSDFWEIFYDTPLTVGPFEENDWDEILIPLTEKGITFDSSARKELINWSGSVPIIVSALLQRLFEQKSPIEVKKDVIDSLAAEMINRPPEFLWELWNDCSAEERLNVYSMADNELYSSEIPPPRIRNLQGRGYAKESGNRLKSSCRIMSEFARSQGAGVENLRHLFGDITRYKHNIRTFLEFRLSQVPDVDLQLRNYVGNAINDLIPEPSLAIKGMRGITEKALSFIWSKEIPTRIIPDELVAEWQTQGDLRETSGADTEIVQKRIPDKLSGQIRLLKLMTRVGLIRARRTAQYVTKATVCLIDFLNCVGDFSQHQENNPVTLEFAASACLGAVELCQCLATDFAPRA